MKELFSVFTAEVFRPLVTLVLPGGLAASSWFIALTEKCPTVRRLVLANHIETALLFLLAALFLGLVIDDVGARIESSILDPRLERETGGKHMANWHAYLCSSIPREVVGRGYLRALVLRLKFELGAAIGTVFAVVGLPLTHMPRGYLVLLFLFAAALVLYLGVIEAPTTHRVVSRTRGLLLASMKESQPDCRSQIV
jgi:hypothetical protein